MRQQAGPTALARKALHAAICQDRCRPRS